MHINRPFKVVSEYGENRFIDLDSNRLVIKTGLFKDSQIFKFDMQHRTIKSKGYATQYSQSWDMRN
jgi:hypothetical protein